MKKFLFVFLSVALLFIANSCITIEETYNFKKNGSGDMLYKIDMGKMVEQMQGMMDMSQMEGGNPLGKSVNFGEIAGKLKGIKGISGVKTTEDKKKYIYTIAFKFKNMDALNEAMNSLMMNKKKGEADYFTFFKKDGSKIEYNNTQATGVMRDINAMFGAGDEEMMENMGSALESVQHVLTIKGPSEIGAVYSGIDRPDGTVITGKQATLTSNMKEWKEKGDKVMQTTLILK